MIAKQTDLHAMFRLTFAEISRRMLVTNPCQGLKCHKIGFCPYLPRQVNAVMVTPDPSILHFLLVIIHVRKKGLLKLWSYKRSQLKIRNGFKPEINFI